MAIMEASGTHPEKKKLETGLSCDSVTDLRGVSARPWSLADVHDSRKWRNLGAHQQNGGW